MTRQFVHDGDDLFLELDGAGATVAEHVYYPGVDRPLSVRRSGQTYHVATDHTGHVAGLVSASNALVNEYRYAPYGTCELAVEKMSNELEFGARERDPERKAGEVEGRFGCNSGSGRLTGRVD